MHEAVTKDSRAIEKTLASHSAAIDSFRAALSQNEELVEGIVETLQMLNGKWAPTIWRKSPWQPRPDVAPAQGLCRPAGPPGHRRQDRRRY